jgi:hypothetical protein
LAAVGVTWPDLAQSPFGWCGIDLHTRAIIWWRSSAASRAARQERNLRAIGRARRAARTEGGVMSKGLDSKKSDKKKPAKTMKEKKAVKDEKKRNAK